jgi:hypothetical protein
MKLQVFCLILTHFTSRSSGGFGLIVDERTENCAKPEEDAKAFNRSNFELIALSDMDVRLNGTVRMTRKFVSPIPFHVYAERFDRNQWHLAAFNARRADFCSSMHSPTEIWYAKLRRLKGCTLNVGVSSTLKTSSSATTTDFRTSGSLTWNQYLTTQLF